MNNPIDLAAMVQCMREAQRQYFRTRKPSHLNEARDWERRVDKKLAEVLNPGTCRAAAERDEGPTMFDNL